MWMPGLMGRRRGGEEKSCDDTNEKNLTVISMRLSGLKSSKKRMDITVKLGVARSLSKDCRSGEQMRQVC